MRVEVEAFAKRVKKLLGNKQAFVSGSVQMLGLGQVKEHFGARWPRVSDRVHSLINMIIETRLGPSDCYTHFGESTYIIVFSTLSTKAASIKVALMAQEISRRLFGDKPPPGAIRVGVAKITEDSGISIKTQDSQKLIADLVEHHYMSDGFTEVTIDGQDETRIDGLFLQDLDQGGKPPPEWVRPDDDTAQESGAIREWRTFHNIRDLPFSTDDWEEIRLSLDIPEDLVFVYRPAWLIKNDRIAAHTCVPARLTAAGEFQSGGQVMPSRQVDAGNYSLDILSLQKVLLDFATLTAHEQRAVIVIPVHVQTLDQARYREPYKNILLDMPHSWRHDVVFEVIGINETTPTLNVANAISLLHPFSRDVMVRTRLSCTHFTEYHSLGVHAVGVDLGNIPMTEAQLLPAMTRFNELAQNNRLHTFAHGVRTRSLASGAAAAGFRYIDGRAIATPIEYPEPNRPWTARDVYSAMIESVVD